MELAAASELIHSLLFQIFPKKEKKHLQRTETMELAAASELTHPLLFQIFPKKEKKSVFLLSKGTL